jgi:hypothetical protein
MPQIVAVRTKDDSSQETIAVVLSQDAVCLGPDGQPWSGVSLSAPLARSFAERLLGLAKEIEDQKQIAKRDPFRSLIQVNSILVFHDGSGQGHRAWELAMDLASRSLATMQLVGIYGVQQAGLDSSSAADDSEWQRGWLERLVQMYVREAEQGGVELRRTLAAANDQPRLSAVCEGAFDLIVVPRRFSDDTAGCDTFSTLRQSLADAVEATILFCP